jgi:hypothetical protein
MGKYDQIFLSEDKSNESLNEEEAVAAIAVVTMAVDTGIDNVNLEMIGDILTGFELFDEYSDDELLETVDKLIAIAEDEGLGALFNCASASLTDELILDGFAAGVSVLVDEDEFLIPKAKMLLVKELQEILDVEEEEAQEVIKEVIAAFEEAEEDDEDIDVPGTNIDGNADDDDIYESPLGNFSVLIPVDIEEGGNIQSQDGTVSFTDDFGTLLRIDYYAIPTEQAEELESNQLEEYLQAILLEKYIPQAIVANLPKSTIEYTEYCADVMDGAYFIIVNMPEGSTMSKQENNGNGSRLDAYRGLLAFVVADFLYIASSQRTFFEGDISGSPAEEAESIKVEILEFVDTIDFS